MQRPRLFIGSSKEGLSVAKALQFNLDRVVEPVVWTNNIFELSQNSIASLYGALNSSDFAVFVFTADDEVQYRGTSNMVPRDNIIFELGLFAGKLGIERTFVVKPRNVALKLPTDLLGASFAEYEPSGSNNLVAALGAASTQIELAIQKCASTLKSGGGIDGMTWDELCQNVRKLGDMLKRSPHDMGFMPDIILGVSRGGVIVADLLSRYLGGRIPIQCLWADRHKAYKNTIIASPKNEVNDIFRPLLRQSKFRNVLIVDDISRRGHTINESKKFIQSISSRLIVKTLLVAVYKDSTFKPDYSAQQVEAFNYRLPFSQVE